MTHFLPHRARKRFGQNFLVDKSVVQRIVRAIKPNSHDNMVEIGAGLGALTLELLPHLNQLTVIELDRDLVQRMRHWQDAEKLIIYNEDALRFDYSTLNRAPSQKLRLVGNLPYNISTPILFHLLQFREIIQDMYFMLQKELVDRIVAEKGTKEYGRLSIMLRYYCQVEELFAVPPTAFDPQPKVNSAIVRLCPHQQLPVKAEDEKQFAEVVRLAFLHRRKTLKNALKDELDINVIANTGIDLSARAEVLSIEDYVMIANALSRHPAT